MTLFFRSAGAVLRINLAEDLGKVLADFKFAFDYIPNLTITLEESDYDGQIDIVESSPFYFGFDGSRGQIRGVLDKDLGMKDMVTLLEYCLEYLRQRKGVYCLHGSAVSMGGKGVWLLGPVSGLGKTTLALSLCLEGKSKFVGDEKILLNDEMHLIGGIKNVNYNKEALMRSLPVNLDKKSGEQIAEILEIETESVPLELVVLPILFEGSGQPEIDKWDTNKASFHLYEEMSRKIRGVSRRVNNSTLPVMSMDTMEIGLKRSNLANAMAKKVPAFLIKGNKKDVMAKIEEVLTGK